MENDPLSDTSDFHVTGENNPGGPGLADGIAGRWGHTLETLSRLNPAGFGVTIKFWDVNRADQEIADTDLEAVLPDESREGHFLVVTKKNLTIATMGAAILGASFVLYRKTHDG